MDLSVNQLERAVALKRQIDQLQDQLDNLLSGSGRSTNSGAGSSSTTGSSTGKAAKKGGRRRRSLSAEGRQRIADAARARWARTKAARGGNGNSQGNTASSKKTSSAKKSSGGKGKGISAAGRKKLSQMMKARWAARRKAEGS